MLESETLFPLVVFYLRFYYVPLFQERYCGRHMLSDMLLSLKLQSYASIGPSAFALRVKPLGPLANSELLR